MQPRDSGNRPARRSGAAGESAPGVGGEDTASVGWGPPAWTALTVFAWWVFGALPVQIDVSERMGLTPVQTSSWIFAVWGVGAVVSFLVSRHYRQPIPVGWTLPGLIYLGTVADRFSFPEIAGANLVAGVILLVLGLLGVGGRIMRWLPLPIVLGMFAGSMIAYVVRLVHATVEDTLVSGAAILGYAIGRWTGMRRVPPVGLAMICGVAALTLSGGTTGAAPGWTAPHVAVPAFGFDAAAIAAVSLPMVVLAMGLGNVQGLGYLLGQGYRVPVNSISIVVGATSVVNAVLGGHPATVARTTAAILAAPDAGPLAWRHRAVLLAAPLMLLIAVAATPVASLLGLVPRSFVVVLAGLAVLRALEDALRRSLGSRLRLSALVALVVAALPFSVAGITAAFWAILAGMVFAGLFERAALRDAWRQD